VAFKKCKEYGLRNLKIQGVKSKIFNRREPQMETAENRKALNYKTITLRNFAPSLRNSAVK
jgi:hypothetical protein